MLKLKASVSNLSRLQQQIGNTLSGLQQDIGSVGNVRDDLKLETDQLRSQIRNLEENSSRLAVSQSSQESRTRELEDLLAEITLKLEKLSSTEQANSEHSVQQISDQEDSSLHQQLQHQLDDHTSKDDGRYKEVDHRLQELANRIGDLGGHFNYVRQELADQRQYRDQLKQDLDLRLQQLEARVSGIDELEKQLGASLRKESSELWQKLEEKSQDLDKLHERLEMFSVNEQGPELSQKLSGVEADINRLSEAERFLQDGFQDLGGLELNLTSRLDDIQQQLQEHIERTREFEVTIRRLSGELDDRTDNLQYLLEQSNTRQQDRIDALEQKQELLTEQELNLDSHRQEIDGHLDRIEELLAAERERISQLEQNFGQISDERASQAHELEQARALQLELQSRFEDLNEDFANQVEQHDRLTTRVDEQTDQLLSLTSKVEEQSGQLKVRVEEQTGQLLSLSGRIDEQTTQHSALVKESTRNARTNQIAVVVLALLTLLGGGALFFANKGEITEVEHRIAEKLANPAADAQYLTRDELTQKLATMESKLASNSEKNTGIVEQPSQENLLQGQLRLEQQLAALEAKLNQPAVPALQNSNPDTGPTKPQQQEMERLQLEIARIDSALNQLAKQSSTDAGATGQTAMQNSLNKAVDRLEQRIGQLESRPDLGLDRINRIEQTLSSTSKQLEAETERLNQQHNSIGKIERGLADANASVERRLQSLEKESAEMGQSMAQLQNQLAALAASPVTRTAANLIAPTAEWQQAITRQGYAIQLAGSRNKQSLVTFAASRSIQNKVAYARTVHEGRDWFILLYGPFAKFKEASAALESLPVVLTRYSPWIRKFPNDAELLNH